MLGLSLATRVLRGGLRWVPQRVVALLLLLALVLPGVPPPVPVCGRKCCAKGKMKCCSGKRGGGAAIEARGACCERGPAMVAGVTSVFVDTDAVGGVRLPEADRVTVGVRSSAIGDRLGMRLGRAPPVLVLVAVV